jgi:DNA-directed RNA polymerase subunit beta'
MSEVIARDFFDKNTFNSVKIGIATPADIMQWSYGEITRPETINYRTYKPEKDGLFCAKIFGPVRDYECLCGKYRKIKYKGIICEKCGVEVTKASVRRERMGHIQLVSPVVHTWFLHSLPSRIATLLDVQLKEVENIVHFNKYIVIDSGNTPLARCTTLTSQEYEEVLDKYGEDSFTVGTGAEAIKRLLSSLDLSKEKEKALVSLKGTTSLIKRNSIIKRINIINDFLESGNKPDLMVLDVLPVLPPDLRPLVMLGTGKFASSDLNELYRRVINRNNRLKTLLALDAPDIIIKNEKRMLQESVDALFDNDHRTKVANANGRVFKSLSAILSGKQGRFRQNLLGKRVDYSGRSVITVGPNLEIYQCGLPKVMALELFKPFIYSKLELYGITKSIKAAKDLIDQSDPVVWRVLEEVVKSHPVLLNRAPTLHRLGIQAFEPILIETKAIQLHPLVCTAFNADFDGDQMAVHIPLSIEARMEAKVLMMSTNNILSPSSGDPIIVPTQDVILGIYYMTRLADDLQKSTMKFTSIDEIDKALDSKQIRINSEITFVHCIDGKCTPYQTIAGRVKLFFALGKQKDISFSFFNKCFTKSHVSEMFKLVNNYSSQGFLAEFANKVMRLGFEWSTRSGISVGKDDILVPHTKEVRIAEAMKKVEQYEKQFTDGYITAREKYNKVTDIWHECTDQVAHDMMLGFQKDSNTSKVNTVYSIVNSGSRGSVTQLKQFAGMRGLMVKTSGEILETPILSNFKQGLKVSEYFSSAHGARKGLADTALKTADAGYLTRRLVDVAQNCVVVKRDCGTQNGIVVRSKFQDGKITEHAGSVAYGRVALKDVKYGKEVIIKAGELITSDKANTIIEHEINEIFVRTPIKCNLERGVCAKCYGLDISAGQEVAIGQAVGIIAAQSIGEPGTQLTMKTFHAGGVALRSIQKPIIDSETKGSIVFENLEIVTNKDGDNIVITNSASISVIGDDSRVNKYKIPYGAKLFVVEGQKVDKGTKLASHDTHSTPVVSEYFGKVVLVDLVRNVSYNESYDDASGKAIKTVIESQMHPAIKFEMKGQVVKTASGHDAVYYLPVGVNILLQDGDTVQIGDIVAQLPMSAQKTKDITGGLPRVVDIFEARKPKNPEVISAFDGIVTEIKNFKTKKRIAIKHNETDVIVNISVPGNARISVNMGAKVLKGETIVMGQKNPYDILEINGLDALMEYMVDEIQSVYQLQGVKINNKHIEVIVRYMLQKCEIVEQGDSHFFKFQKVFRYEVDQVNREIEKAKGIKVISKPILQGITKAALQTDSFISSASFQETAKVLTDAAISKKVDKLRGIKENVVVGKIIPAGTGLVIDNILEEVDNA